MASPTKSRIPPGGYPEYMPEKGKEDLAERAIDLQEFVAYQQGSVVSRMLVYTKSGTITLFAFDGGEGLSEHTAPYDAVLQVLDGEALITIAGTEFRLNAGDLIIMPANKPHAVQAVTRFKMMLTMIHA
jgi:quercetin dioxygenase-like cupin family protein